MVARAFREDVRALLLQRLPVPAVRSPENRSRRSLRSCREQVWLRCRLLRVLPVATVDLELPISHHLVVAKRERLAAQACPAMVARAFREDVRALLLREQVWLRCRLLRVLPVATVDLELPIAAF
jgi:hypothetical protein